MFSHNSFYPFFNENQMSNSISNLGFAVVVILFAIVCCNQCPISANQIVPKQKKTEENYKGNTIHFFNIGYSLKNYNRQKITI